MKTVVIGTGGVGGFFGGLLARNGGDVTFVARGAHLDAIRAHGLQVESPNGTWVISPAQATDDPATLSPADLVLLAVKTYGLGTALEQIRPLVGPNTAVLTTQNGVDAPDMVAEAFDADVVLPGLVYSEVSVARPGVITQGSPVARLVFGEPDGAITARSEAIAEAFRAAGLDTTISSNINGALWNKFCFICAMGGATALARAPLGALLADGEGSVLLRTLMQEVVDVARASGIGFDNDPVADGMAAAARFDPGTKSSMLRDLERGNPLEVDWLNGAAVRRGREVGVATPANQAVYAALRQVRA